MRAAGIRPIHGLRSWDTALAIGIRFHDTGVYCETFTLDQTLGHAIAHHLIEHKAQQIAVTESTMAVLRERGVIGHTPF